MEKCYEFFDCEKVDCIIKTANFVQCWEVEGTLCDVHNDSIKALQAAAGSKDDACKLCIYYKSTIGSWLET